MKPRTPEEHREDLFNETLVKFNSFLMAATSACNGICGLASKTYEYMELKIKEYE